MFDRIDDIMHGAMLATFGIMTVFAFLNARSERKPVRLNVALGMLMGLMAVQSFEYLILNSLHLNSAIVEDTGLSLIINLLVVPFCNFVMMELVRYKRISIKMIFLEIGIPFLLAVIYYVQLMSSLESRYLTYTVYVVWMIYMLSTTAYNYRRQ